MKQLEYLLVGEGDTTIVFLNGFRMPFSSWDKVYSEISEQYKVVLYNRHGIGKSKKANVEQDGNAVVEDLRLLLNQLELKPPFIVVGHSLGGIYANLYARKYTDEVAALVLVDSPYPDELIEQESIKPASIFNFLNHSLKSVEKFFDRYKYSEEEEIARTLAQLRKLAPLPDIPVAVVSGVKKMPFIAEKAHALHLQYQKELARMSSQTRQYECFNSGHFPQVTEPGVVVKAIFETLNIANKSTQPIVKAGLG
ncbi:alpha/beta fold hydrolase [Thalassomonas actiniarum]|uniref:Alpha/beta hydrolase n=1 Tax=Thalassomonas actiniarum TaxID=485447 RepID=A0AAE9YRE6_9GAMM|nr:alpha/beta hydrolase [Thalassomonas actiniarum]WDD99297.1 alpha/beta hydrolase [Thalassomonas actiniarum]